MIRPLPWLLACTGALAARATAPARARVREREVMEGRIKPGSLSTLRRAPSRVSKPRWPWGSWDDRNSPRQGGGNHGGEAVAADGFGRPGGDRAWLRRAGGHGLGVLPGGPQRRGSGWPPDPDRHAQGGARAADAGGAGGAAAHPLHLRPDGRR